MRTLLLFFLLKITWIADAQTNREVQNLNAFARLYGYIRYFHPSDEAASMDWNQFAVYGSNAVLAARSDQELTHVLKQLFLPMAPSIQIGASAEWSAKSITPADTSGYQPVFWFHTGVDVGFSTNGPYYSVRLNRPGPSTTPKQGFAPFSQGIDALPLRNKEIRLAGRMKADVPEDGDGHFWLRVDKPEGMGFFYNMSDKPITQNQWNTYEFTGKVDPDATQIYFGGFLNGKGTIWVDKIELFERSGAGDPWRSVLIQNGDFTTLVDKLPYGWNTHTIDSYKYAITPLNNRNVLEISSAPPTAAGAVIHRIDYRPQPQPGTTVRKKLLSGIDAIIPVALYGSAAHTYPVADTTALKRLKKAMHQYTMQNATADNLAVRLGGVVIAWNIFKHFFPYWPDASKDPDTILSQAINSCFTDTTPIDFKKTLLKMTEPLNDGHIWVTLMRDTTEAFSLPLQLALAENKIVVDEIFDSSLTNIRKGDILEQIDGRKAMDVYKERMNYISGSPQWKSYRAVFDLTNGKEHSAATLVLLHDGQRIEQKVSRKMGGPQFNKQKKYTQRKSGILTKDIYYLNISSIPADTIDQWADDLAGAKGIICDLRGYPASNHNLISYLLKKGEDSKWMFVPKTAWPDQEKTEFRSSGWNMKPKKPHFNGKIVFITDGRAISYAESFMGFIKDLKLATIVGQPTAGTNGNINPFTLPGGYTISWTGMLVKNHDGSKHHLKGIVPDVFVERTIKGIKEGRDEFLDKALEIVTQ